MRQFASDSNPSCTSPMPRRRAGEVSHIDKAAELGLAPLGEAGRERALRMGLAYYANALLDFVREHREWAAPVVFVLAFGESLAFVSLILPFWFMLVSMGPIIGASDSLSFWGILTSAAIGAAIGDWVSYWLGYHYHEQIARMWPLNKYPNLIPKGHEFFRRWGMWAVVIGRFSGPLRASVPIVAGITQMPQVTFQLANFGSAFLWAFVLLTPGTFGMKWWLEYIA
jgi:membrane protein DedA with SNARE-associated domain